MSKPTEYTKRPVTIEAVKLINAGAMREAADWCGGRYESEAKPGDPSDVAHWLVVPTLEGPLRARIGDCLIRGVKGEFYPCKPDVFAMTYAPRRDVLAETRDAILAGITSPLMKLVLERDPDTWAAGIAMDLVPQADVEHEASDV